MCKFESSQKDESRTQSADSLKAYRKPSAVVLKLSWAYLVKASARGPQRTAPWPPRQAERPVRETLA